MGPTIQRVLSFWDPTTWLLDGGHLWVPGAFLLMSTAVCVAFWYMPIAREATDEACEVTTTTGLPPRDGGPR